MLFNNIYFKHNENCWINSLPKTNKIISMIIQHCFGLTPLNNSKYLSEGCINEGCKISSKRQKRRHGMHFWVVKVQQPSSPIKEPTTMVSLGIGPRTIQIGITWQNTEGCYMCLPHCELVARFREIIGNSWHNLLAHTMLIIRLSLTIDQSVYYVLLHVDPRWLKKKTPT